jgi:hypothetical protein
MFKDTEAFVPFSPLKLTYLLHSPYSSFWLYKQSSDAFFSNFSISIRCLIASDGLKVTTRFSFTVKVRFSHFLQNYTYNHQYSL